MSLEQKIHQDLKAAMIAKDEARLSTIRFLKSAMKYAAIEKKAETFSDAEIQQLVQKQIKQRRESIDQFAKAGRRELAEKEEKEVHVLLEYLPKQLTDAELGTALEGLVKESGISSKKDFGKAMKLSAEKLAGQAEPKRISEALGKILQ